MRGTPKGRGVTYPLELFRACARHPQSVSIRVTRSASKMAATMETENVATANKKKHLGIPEAVFVEDVDTFMKVPGNETADVVLKRLDEQYQKYKFMELNLAQKKLRLKNQIPQIKQTLEMLRHMQKVKDTTEPMETRFLLADNVYCKASVPPTDKVCLWLGANVMLEYDTDEAQLLLEKNLATASRNLDLVEEDMDFLRDQFTTTEVNMARVYNWDVKRRSRDSLSKIADKS
ncbi:prefoldin subunit 3 [Arapaima gigas]